MIEQFTANDGRSLTFESSGEYVMVESCDPMLSRMPNMIFVFDKKQAKQLAKALKEWAK